MLPRRFALVRHVDYTGVSGTGVVAYGVAFADGQVVLRWCSTHPATSLWSSIDDLLAVHGHGEATSIEWIDAPHGDVEDVHGLKRVGRRAKGDAAEGDEGPTQVERGPEPAPEPAPAPERGPAPAPEAEPAAGSDRDPGPVREPEPTEAPGSDPEAADTDEALTPLPRRPVRLVTRSERDAINGHLTTDTAPLLFDPFGEERDRPPPESSRPPPRTPAPTPPPPLTTPPPPRPPLTTQRRPGRHRRPDPNEGNR